MDDVTPDFTTMGIRGWKELANNIGEWRRIFVETTAQQGLQNQLNKKKKTFISLPIHFSPAQECPRQKLLNLDNPTMCTSCSRLTTASVRARVCVCGQREGKQTY